MDIERRKRISKERLEICKKCEFYVESTTQCSKCGCFMKIKTLLPFSKCPIDKWGKDKENV
jgi:hypothetical protein